MGTINSIFRNTQQFVHANAPALLIGAGVSGVFTTAYFSAKGAYAAARRLDNQEHLSTREKIEETWDLYIPAVVSGVTTVGCIVVAARISSKRAAAAYSLMTLTERAFDEYKEKVVETLGEKKELALRDDIVQEKVDNNPPGTVIFGGDTGVLCCELLTGRYFQSDMESLRKAQNDINSKIVMNLYVTLNEFYDIIGLPYTSNCAEYGWDDGKMMELEFSTVMAPGDKPCLAFEYNYIKVV